MASSQASKSSKRTPSRGSKPEHNAMLDILAKYDTRYPDLCSKKKFPGNGPRPANPFGKRLKKPNVG